MCDVTYLQYSYKYNILVDLRQDNDNYMNKLYNYLCSPMTIPAMAPPEIPARIKKHLLQLEILHF